MKYLVSNNKKVYVVMSASDYVDLYEQDGNETRVVAVCETQEAAREVFEREWNCIRDSYTPNAENEYTAEDEIDEHALHATRTIYDPFGVTDETHETWVLKCDLITTFN